MHQTGQSMLAGRASVCKSINNDHTSQNSAIPYSPASTLATALAPRWKGFSVRPYNLLTDFKRLETESRNVGVLCECSACVNEPAIDHWCHHGAGLEQQPHTTIMCTARRIGPGRYPELAAITCHLLYLM